MATSSVILHDFHEYEGRSEDTAQDKSECPTEDEEIAERLDHRVTFSILKMRVMSSTRSLAK